MIFLGSLEERVLGKDEKREIKESFRGWRGRVGKSQRNIFKKYGLNVDFSGSGHLKIGFENVREKLYFSKSSSDHRAGLNFALKKLIPYIEHYYKSG